jgi:hypothetical protein
MSTSARLRRQPAVIIFRRSSIGRDSARRNAPSGHQIEPATAMFNHHLNHHLALFLSGRHVIGRLKGHYARQRTTSASAKSP